MSTSGGGGDATAANQVTGNNSLAQIANLSVISTANQTSTVLGANAVFTGTAEDVSQYAVVRVSVFADQGSALNGLSVQQSSNGTNWDFTDVYTIPAPPSSGFAFGFPVYARFFRIVYTNGAVAQTAFRLQAVFHKELVKSSSIRPTDGRTNEIDTEEVSAYPMLYNSTTGNWDRQRGSSSEGQYVTSIDKVSSGSITTQNLVPTGTATAGSAVLLQNLNGCNSLRIQITGTWTAVGGLSIQASLDGSTWVTFNAAGTGVADWSNSNSAQSTIPSAMNGIFSMNISGVSFLRITALGAVTGSVSVRLVGSISISSVSLSGNGNVSVGNIGTVTTLTGTTTLTPGTAAANLGKAEDAVAASGDTGVFVLFPRRDVPTVSASANGDYNEGSVNKFGAQYIAPFQSAAKTFSAAVEVTPAASATDIAVLPGNATNTVYVTRVTVSGSATAAAAVLLQLVRRSAANTGGSSSVIPIVYHEATDSAVSVPVSYSANPTSLGTAVGVIRSQSLGLGSASAIGNTVVWDFPIERGKHMMLSGVANSIAVSLAGVQVAGEKVSVTFEWIEI